MTTDTSPKSPEAAAVPPPPPRPPAGGPRAARDAC